MADELTSVKQRFGWKDTSGFFVGNCKGLQFYYNDALTISRFYFSSTIIKSKQQLKQGNINKRITAQMNQVIFSLAHAHGPWIRNCEFPKMLNLALKNLHQNVIIL